MAKKALLRDHDNIEILPITRGELVLDSSGKAALHSNEFLATNSKPGLMSAEDKEKLTKINVDSELKLDSENPVQNKIITAALKNKADISDNLVLAEGMKNAEGITFNLSNTYNTETQILATQEDILRTIANTDEVYVGDEIPEDDNSIKMWIDTNAGFDYSGNTIEVSGGASIYTIYTNSELSADQQLANKEAFESVISGEEAVYYVQVSEKDYIASYTLYNNTAVFTCSNVEVTSDGGDLMSITVSINANGSIANLSVQEGSVPNLEYINSILEDKGASIPVVSSEEELETLSQNKGDLAVILSNDEIKSGNIRCLDLPSISMTVVQQLDFSECASIQGIAINTDIDVPPCPAFAGQNISFMIVPRNMSNPSEATYLSINMSDDFDDDGYCHGSLQVTLIQNGSNSSAIPLAQYDETTGKMVLVDDGVIEELNTLVLGTMIEDPVFVSMSEMIQAGGEGLKDTLAFFECISSSIKVGTKSIRIKNDNGYSRFDNDIVKVVDKRNVSSLDTLDMPKGSLVRIHYPEETKYDTDIATMRCCIIKPEFDSSKATVLSKVEFVRNCTTEELNGDATALPPYFVLTDRSGSQFFEVVFEMGGDGSMPLVVKGSMNGGAYLYFLQNGVWNEERIEEFNAMVSSGVNVLYKLGKSGNSLWNEETGICTYLEGGGLGEETMSQISMIMEMMIGAYVQFRYNEQITPEHIESYSRLGDKWVKDKVTAEVEVETAWSDSSSTSNKPIATSLVYNTFDQFYNDLDSKQPKLVSGQNIATINGKSLLAGGNIDIAGGGGSNITVDSSLSTTSTNPVRNSVITTELNKKVNAVSGKGLSTNDYTTSDKNKLAGIAAGAEVNVQSDWNAASGDAYILNKPVFATINGHPIDKGGDITIAGLDDPTANDSLQDIIKFLEGTIEQQTLAGIIENLQNQINTKQFTLVNGESIKTVNGQNLLGGGNIDTIGIIDDTLKDNSTNPVQNKVIKEYVDTRVDEIKNIGTLATITSVDTTNEVDDVLESLLDEISGETIQYINQINGEII